MDQKVNATRAVLSLIARRVMFFWTSVTIVIFVLIFFACLALAYYVSAWWWLLFIAYIPLFIIFLALRIAVGFLIHKLYPTKSLSKPQRDATRTFADKLRRLAETRGMGWLMFALVSLKDLLFHRDLRTVRHTIEDGTSLKQDFEELEKLF